MHTIPVRQHTRSIADKPSLLGNETHRRLKNEVALMQLDRTLSEQIDAFFSALSQTEEGRDAAERIEQTGMV